MYKSTCSIWRWINKYEQFAGSVDEGVSDGQYGSSFKLEFSRLGRFFHFTDN